MAEEKKEEETYVSLLNRGRRTFDLGMGKDNKPRKHLPGQTMLYTLAEAADHAGYPELIDISKLPGQVDARQLKADKKALEDENAALKAQLAALQPKEEVAE